MIAFLDANALIYLLEGEATFAERVRADLQALSQEYPGLGVAMSRLSWLECRIKPMKAGNNEVLALYDAFFARPDLLWVELTKDVVELAAVIRAREGLRTPDALQAACCLQLGPHHLFLTGDAGFGKVSGLNVNLLK